MQLSVYACGACVCVCVCVYAYVSFMCVWLSMFSSLNECAVVCSDSCLKIKLFTKTESVFVHFFRSPVNK